MTDALRVLDGLRPTFKDRSRVHRTDLRTPDRPRRKGVIASGRFMSEGLWSEKSTRVLDLRGYCTDCVGPLLYVKREFVSLPVGGTLELVSSMEATREDIAYWAGHTGQEYLGAHLDQGVDHIFVRRRK